MIDQRYEEIIRRCMEEIDKLTEWEQQFILGDESKKSLPIIQRKFISEKQKEVLDKIFMRRFMGEADYRPEVKIEFGTICGERTEEGYFCTIGGRRVGVGHSKKEIALINKWLSVALHEIMALPQEVLADFMDGAPLETQYTPDDEIQFGEPARPKQTAVLPSRSIEEVNPVAGVEEDEF